MRLRTLFVTAPLLVIIGLAAVLRGEPEAMRVVGTAGLVYAAIVATAMVQRRYPPESRPLLGDARAQAPAEHNQALLGSLEGAIMVAQSRGLDYESRLRPILFRVAIGRLSARGISWEHEPEKVAAVLGARTWRLIRPPETFPDREAAGLPIAQIEDIVNRIEEV